MLPPLLGVELAQARERVEVVGLPTVKEPGAKGATFGIKSIDPSVP
jgi:hypothetical protein